MSFINELKRRNVFKVAAAYVIIGWLVMQAGEVMGPALRLPDWINSALAFFLILGFPLAMFFAWAFELTDDGIKKEKDVDRSQSTTRVTGQKLNYTIIALMAVALVYFALDKFVASPHEYTKPEPGKTDLSSAREADKKSIAVIPFRNRSANEENAEFFSDGVHDELLTNLSRIDELKVISRTSVMSYRDTTKNMRQIGEELGVANILEGGVQRAGDTVRINVQLIDAATDEHLWANVYDRQLTAENLFAIQTEIAHAIANALEATLSPGEQEQLAVTPTSNLAAYDSVLMARQLIMRGTWQNLRDAQTYLHSAIKIDSEYVDAYVLLAMTFSDLFSTGAMTLQEIKAPWGQAIQTALSLDSDNAAAQAAYAQYLWRNNLDDVEEAFEKARQLEPANVDIMVMYADYLRKNYYTDRASPLYEMARKLDPVSIPVLAGLARIYEDRFETDKALDTYARIRQIDPTNLAGYGPASGIYQMTGNIVQATNLLFKAWAIDPEDSDISNWIALSYIDFSDYTSAHQWLSWIEKNQKANPMTPAGMTRLYIHQGDIDTSITYTRRALADGMPARWGSGPALIRALLIWALEKNQAGPALEIIRQEHPELFTTNPVINTDNVLQAIDTAHLLQHENYEGEAGKLLRASIAFIQRPGTVMNYFLSTGKAQALALLGQKQAALKELRQQVDRGWRLLWRWDTELNPNFDSLRTEPEFQAIVEILRSDMARQAKTFQNMEAAGEIPLPPGDDDQ